MKNYINYAKHTWSALIAFLFISMNSLYGQSDISLTVTNSNLGLIKEKRSIMLEKGRQSVQLKNIPEHIVPSSVLVESEDDHFSILEQNYEYDLISSDKILQKSINEQILIAHPAQGSTRGTLLSASSASIMLLDEADNLQIIPRNSEQKIFLADYSKKENPFILEPTLLWQLNSDSRGEAEMNISYLSRGLQWRADYVGKLNDKSTTITLSAWVTINNTSGRSYEKTRLKLIAGDLHRVQPQRNQRSPMPTIAMEKAGGFQEKSFFEYHLYTLPRTTTLKNNQIKQLQLFPTVDSKVNKIYRISSHKSSKANVIVSLKNSNKNNLGRALPEGIIRLYQADGDDSEYIGEDQIKHTPKDEELEITVGQAFDIVSERDIIKTEKPSKRSRRQHIQYKIRNHKEDDIVVEVVEHLNAYQQNDIIKSNFKIKEKSAKKAVFLVPVSAGSETVLSLQLLSSW